MIARLTFPLHTSMGRPAAKMFPMWHNSWHTNTMFFSRRLRVTRGGILQGLLDYTLNFEWILEGHQFLVFTLCCYYLIHQNRIFSSFYCSLKHKYVLEDEKYRFLDLVYQMTEAGYDVLARHLLDFFNKFSCNYFVSTALLFRCSLSAFLAALRKSTPPKQRQAVFIPKPFGHTLEHNQSVVYLHLISTDALFILTILT